MSLSTYEIEHSTIMYNFLPELISHFLNHKSKTLDEKYLYRS